MVERLARSEAQNKRLQEQLTTVQDEERADLARDLHDEIGPLLFAADVDAVAIEQLVKAGEYGAITHRVGIIREAIGRMQRHVRDILGRLRSAMLLDVGLAHAIDNLVAFWRVHRANLNFKVDVPEESFGELIDGTIYRIVQESLSNAVRHGNPSLISIEVKENADASIDVRVDRRRLRAQARRAFRGARHRRHAGACRNARRQPRGRQPDRWRRCDRLGAPSGAGHPSIQTQLQNARGNAAMKILLVDDHIVVREGVRRLLSGMSGAELHEASTGEEALAMFRDIRPELVLLDLNLTGIGGLELLAAAAERG